VEDRDDRHQRRPCAVAQQHRAAGAEPAEQLSARQAEQREPDHLGGDHEGRLRRRAGRQQDEPGQGDPRHLRTGGRDHLGREQRADRAVAEKIGATHSLGS